jgi:broad specificity phosphatase PhoE
VDGPLTQGPDPDGQLQQALGLGVERAVPTLVVDEVPRLPEAREAPDELLVRGGRAALLLHASMLPCGRRGRQAGVARAYYNRSMSIARASRPAAVVLLLGTCLLRAPASSAGDALGHLPPLQPGAVRLYLVRHGQALSNLSPVPNLPPAGLDHLTTQGKRQAAAAGRALAGRGVASVLASPAFRARETAEGIVHALGLPAPTVEPRLRPLELGRAADGHPLTWKDRAAEWEAGRDPSPPGGESMERAGDRVDEFARELALGRHGTGVVLVTHGEMLGAYLGRVRGTPAPKRYPPGLENGSITVVDVLPTGAATIRLEGHAPAAP